MTSTRGARRVVLRVVLSEVRNRRGRALALLLGIVVATTSFTVLTSESQSQRLDVRGTVARSFRGDYDILVRPRGGRDPLERRTQTLRPTSAAIRSPRTPAISGRIPCTAGAIP